MNILSFDPIAPINQGLGNESRVLSSERIELTRFQVAQLIRPSYFSEVVEIDHLAEVPVLTRWAPSDTATTILCHPGTKLLTGLPKVRSALAGWSPGELTSESTIHSWNPLVETLWNTLLRATTKIQINGYSVNTLSVSVDVNYYRARYTQELLFSNGESVFNHGHIYSSTVGAIVFELSEI